MKLQCFSAQATSLSSKTDLFSPAVLPIFLPESMIRRQRQVVSYREAKRMSGAMRTILVEMQVSDPSRIHIPVNEQRSERLCRALRLENTFSQFFGKGQKAHPTPKTACILPGYRMRVSSLSTMTSFQGNASISQISGVLKKYLHTLKIKGEKTHHNL